MTFLTELAHRHAILHRTVDWLEANPDKAIRGHLATDDEGLVRDPKSPKTTCFCFLGRLVVEADIDSAADRGGYGSNLEKWLQPTGISPAALMSRNDCNLQHDRRINALRKLIDGKLG